MQGSIHSAVELSGKSRAARVLAVQTQQADVSPVDFQTIHEQVGRCLVAKLLDEYIFDGDLVKEEAIDHVQGTRSTGLVTRSWDVAILTPMQAGEPMARGCSISSHQRSFIHFWGDNKPLEWSEARPSVFRCVLVVDCDQPR